MVSQKRHNSGASDVAGRNREVLGLFTKSRIAKSLQATLGGEGRGVRVTTIAMRLRLGGPVCSTAPTSRPGCGSITSRWYPRNNYPHRTYHLVCAQGV